MDGCNPYIFTKLEICINLLEDVVSFFVLPLNQLSDHCCISLSIKTLRAKDDPIQKEEGTPQISTRFDIDFVDLYKENLERDIGFSELSKVIEETQDYTQGSIDKRTTQFNNLVLNNARVSFPTKNTKKPKSANFNHFDFKLNIKQKLGLWSK